MNDTRSPWSARLQVVRTDLAGTALEHHEADVVVTPDAATRLVLPAPVAEPTDPVAEVLVATLDGGRAVHTWVPDRALSGPSAAFTATASVDGPRLVVDVVARTFVRDLTLLADRLHPDASVDQQLVTLLRGERRRFAVTGAAGVDPVAATAPPVLRAGNDALARRWA